MDEPLSYHIDVPAQRVHVIYHRQPTFEQWAATMKNILEDPRFKSGCGILLDRSKVPHPAATEYIHQMVDFIDTSSVQIGDSRWAIVVVDLSSFGMARMAELLSLTGKVRGFFVMEEAKAWLGAAGRN
jgi:hypothetical protein